MTEYDIAACVMITFSVYIFQQESSCSAKINVSDSKTQFDARVFLVKQDCMFCVFVGFFVFFCVTNKYCFAVYCHAVLSELNRLIHWVRTESVDIYETTLQTMHIILLNLYNKSSLVLVVYGYVWCLWWWWWLRCVGVWVGGWGLGFTWERDSQVR